MDNCKAVNIFISHSTDDKPFVRKLDASLSINGFKVFLDERDIAIGDSIPAKIYEGISDASHILYVISNASKESLWVQEELDVAKMKQKEKSGFHILPVLIEETEVPFSVKHLKYADFTQWQSELSYLKAFNQIVHSLGGSLFIPESFDVVFFVENSSHIANLEKFAFRYGGFTEGSLDTDFSVMHTESTHRGDCLKRSMWRLADSEFIGMKTPLSNFIEICEKYKIPKNSKLGSILQVTRDLDRLSHCPKYEFSSYKYCTNIRDTSYRLGEMIVDLRREYLSILSSNIKV